jgi:hypothetical protein
MSAAPPRGGLTQALGLHMKHSFITALYNIEIPENLGRGDKINDTTYLTNDKEIIKSLLPSIEYAHTVGQLEYSAIIDAKAVVYSHDEAPKDVTPEKHIISKLYIVESFLSCLWLFADNSISDETGYFFFPDKNGLNATSNFLSTKYTKSNGNVEPTLISRALLKRAREFYRNNISLPESPFSKPKLTLTKKTSRIERALHHAVAARDNSDIGFKISSYCSALEALLSSSQAELAHQLSERSAFLLHDKPEERIKTYKMLKKAYATRSKIVHGDYVRDDQLEILITASEFCDHLLRDLLLRILSSSEHLLMFTKMDNNMFEDEIQKLLFGEKSALPVVQT